MSARLRPALLPATLALAAAPALALPLDTLPLIDEPPAAGVRWQVELGHDFTRALGRLAGSEREAADQDRLALSGQAGPWRLGLGLGGMTLHDGGDLHRLRGWEGSLRWQSTPDEADAASPEAAPLRWAVQASAWGHRADRLSQTTRGSLKVSGLNAQLTRFDVERPRDRQWQLDLLGQGGTPWPGVAVTAVAGLGRSTVSNSGLGGAATIGGCSHELEFGTTRLIARPGPDCAYPLIISVPASLLKTDPRRETNYDARFAHLGVALHGRQGPWQLSAGADLQRWRRPGIDDGPGATRTPVGRVVTLAARLSRDLGPDTRVSLQLRHADHRLVGEVPMLYGVRTASRFSSSQTQVELALARRF